MFVVVFSGCQEKKKIIKSGKVIKIGILAPLTGEKSRLGIQSLIGLKYANKLERYLSNGDEIVLEVIDTKSDYKSSKKGYDYFIKEDVLIINSFMSSDTTLRLKPDIKKHNTSFVATLATHDDITKDSKNIVQVCIDNNTQVLVSAHYIKDEKYIEQVGVIYNKKSNYSTSMAKEFKKYYNSISGRVVFFIDVSDKEGLESFKKEYKKGIKMVFNACDSKTTAKVLAIMKRDHYYVEILGTDGLLSGALSLDDVDISIFNGVFVVEHYAENIEKNKSKNRVNLERNLAKLGYKESSYAFLAYDGYMLIKNALENCKNYNDMCLKSVLQYSDIIKGISGNFSIIDFKVNREVYIDKINHATLEKELVIY
jgi:ABC-type branched-subunit amino acid transport system substrate-binding protein